MVLLQNDWTPLASAVNDGYAGIVKYLVNEAKADCDKVPQVTLIMLKLQNVGITYSIAHTQCCTDKFSCNKIIAN